MSKDFLVIPGPVGLSSFRSANLISDINKAVNSSIVTSIRSSYVHYISLKPSADDAIFNTATNERRLLDALLEYNSPLDNSDALTKTLIKTI